MWGLVRTTQGGSRGNKKMSLEVLVNIHMFFIYLWQIEGKYSFDKHGNSNLSSKTQHTVCTEEDRAATRLWN